MADNLVKAVTVKISVDGMDQAKLKIGQITASAKDLEKLHPEIKVQIDAAQALLKARLLRAGIQAEMNKAITVKTDAGGGGGGRGFLGGLLGVGGGGAIGGGASLLGLLGIGPAAVGTGGIIAGIAAGIAAVATGVGGIIPAIAAAGLGVASFGALAIPTFTKITGAVTALKTDTAAYQAATTAAARSTALAKIKADWAALTPAQVSVVKGIQGVQAEFGKLAATVAPIVTKILGVGVGIAQKLLPVVLSFAKAAGPAILGLADGMSKFFNTTQTTASFIFGRGRSMFEVLHKSITPFGQFIKDMLPLVGPAITMIGNGIGSVVAAVGGMLRRMITPEGLLILGGIFKTIALGVTGIGFAFQGLGKAIFNVGPVLLRMASGFLGVVQFIGNAMFALIGTVLHGVSNVATFLHLPFSGALRDAAKNFDSYGKAFSNGLQNARTNLRRWSFDLQNAPKVFTLKADITNLTAKLAEAKADLRDKHLTAVQKAILKADISNLLVQIAHARAALASINGTTATTYINTVSQYSSTGHKPGGHAAGGYASGLTLVGERGPELIAAPAGSYVYTNQQTRQMLAGGASYTININTLVADRNTGARVVEAIRQFEAGSGHGWRK